MREENNSKSEIFVIFLVLSLAVFFIGNVNAQEAEFGGDVGGRIRINITVVDDSNSNNNQNNAGNNNQSNVGNNNPVEQANQNIGNLINNGQNQEDEDDDSDYDNEHSQDNNDKDREYGEYYFIETGPEESGNAIDFSELPQGRIVLDSNKNHVLGIKQEKGIGKLELMLTLNSLLMVVFLVLFLGRR